MREFGRIETTIWQNRKFRRLSDDARTLWLYTLCCPHGNAVGCFVLPDGYIAADLGWPFERVSQTVSELFSKGMIERDEGTHLTWVRGWWGHNTIENPNVAKAAIKAIIALPRCPVFSQFLADFERFPIPLAKLLHERFPNGYANPIETKEPEPEPETPLTKIELVDGGSVSTRETPQAGDGLGEIPDFLDRRQKRSTGGAS